MYCMLRCRGWVVGCQVRTAGISFEEIVKRNEGDECLVIIDGMVFDVTRWLPQHPGGSVIIPEQVGQYAHELCFLP